jgi:hypothetical protein
LKTIILITGLFIAGFAFDVNAQVRAQKTSSARAYYGTPIEKSKLKRKSKQKADWATHHKPAKGTRGDAWSTKKKYKS